MLSAILLNLEMAGPGHGDTENGGQLSGGGKALVNGETGDFSSAVFCWTGGQGWEEAVLAAGMELG